MLAIVYLILCFILGYVITSFLFPSLKEASKKTFRGDAIVISPYLLLVPAWFLSGTLCMTWVTYLISYLFKDKHNPLSYSNTIVIIVAFICSMVGIFLLRQKKEEWQRTKKFFLADYIYIFISFILTSILMFRTFYVKDGSLNIGISVFSDFSPHLAMIRSFSYGNNFPTSYGHFAGEDIRYHFLFQFLVGNLEFLGMRIDYAFNIPSILSLLSTFSLLYVLAIKLTNKVAAGYLSGLFFAFRSSPALLRYLADLPKGSIIKDISNNINFIGESVHDDWGLWNLNVYCNQRHFAFALSLLLLALILFLPLFYEQQKRIFDQIKEKRKISSFMKLSFFTKEGWKVTDIKLAVSFGILLGMLAFFNGAVLICTLSILFVLAIFSDRRLELLITAVLATGLSFLQSAFFIKGNAVSPSYYFGFIAENKTAFGVMEYILELTGILVFVLVIAFMLQKGTEKYIMFAFTAPFILAFTLSLTVDVTVNHKNIMLSIMLLGIFNAWLVIELFKRKEISAKIISVLLVVMLTASGMYDFTTVIRRNENKLSFRLDDKRTAWIKENTTSQDIFLSSYYTVNSVVLGGAMLYYGWPYYAWSAGYDTNHRAIMVKSMYEASTSEMLKALVNENNIRFIIVDYDNRTSKEYELNEANIDATYEKVYEEDDGIWMFSIYDTRLEKGD